MSANLTSSLLGALYLPLFILLLGGCSKDNPVGPMRSQKGIIPLATGNTWNYNGIEYDSAGSVIQTFVEVDRVYRDTVIFGAHLYQYLNGWWFTNTDSGLAVCSALLYPLYHDTTQYFAPYFQYPTTQGARYELAGDSIVVASVDTMVTITIGSFHCVHYLSYQGGEPSTDIYVCPHLGIVKQALRYGRESTKSPAAVHSVYELRRYTIL